MFVHSGHRRGTLRQWRSYPNSAVQGRHHRPDWMSRSTDGQGSGLKCQQRSAPQFARRRIGRGLEVSDALLEFIETAALRLETAAKPLKSLEPVLADFSKCALKSLDNQTDFDSAISGIDSRHQAKRQRAELIAETGFVLAQILGPLETRAELVTLRPLLPTCLLEEPGCPSYEGFQALDAYTGAASSNPDGP